MGDTDGWEDAPRTPVPLAVGPTSVVVKCVGAWLREGPVTVQEEGGLHDCMRSLACARFEAEVKAGESHPHIDLYVETMEGQKFEVGKTYTLSFS